MELFNVFVCTAGKENVTPRFLIKFMSILDIFISVQIHAWTYFVQYFQMTRTIVFEILIVIISTLFRKAVDGMLEFLFLIL